MKNNLRVFSLEEANSLLPQVETLLQRVEGKRRAHESRHDQHFMHELITENEQRRGINSPAEDLPEEAARRLDNELEDMIVDVEAIRALGCVVRSLKRGWIDFAGQHNGEMIFFCWHRGEQNISFYHPFKGPLTERLPLTT